MILVKLNQFRDCNILLIAHQERCETIRTLENEGLTEKVMGLLEAVDPCLRAYIEPYVFESEKYTNYFEQYKRQKITNTVNSEFIDKVREYAASKGLWWELCSRNKLIDDAYDKGQGTLIIWIDALGIEYLSLISFMLRERHQGVYYKIGIGYANIPTITEFNKDYLQGRSSLAFRELDELKHKGEYPEYIIKEFTLIEKALRQAVEKLQEYEKVIITADHGASRLAVIALTHTHKAKEGAVVLRHGRYCEDNQNDYGGDISGCVDKDQYHVFADYDRFSIQGNVTGEIHGGASLEEVLVPVIELSKRPFDAGLAITVLTPEIKLRAGQKVRIKFQIDRDFDRLQAEVGSKIYLCVRDIDCWYFEPEVDRNITDYKAKLLHKGRLLGSIQYKIQKGITSKLDI
ncbi:MAG: BREX-4 system phosphatase PglZ [Nitrospirae bacterium]|nr:BREX-4 system phosphatase PglZ [Nitrospirota bacterium]